MLRMATARLLDAVPTVLLVLTLVFVALRLLPGDPALVVLGEYATPEQLALFRRQMGLDQPLWFQWLSFLRDMLALDFGTSMITSQPVRTLLAENLPYTIELTLLATAMGVLLGVPMGVAAAVNRGRWPDNGARAFSLVGYAIPDEFGELVAFLVGRVKVKGVIFSVHCHNDLGLAVANSLAAVQAGARQIECTINGIGERAGNASLEEAVMGIKTRGDKLQVWTGVNTKEIIRSSRLVSRMTGFVVQRNKAIVGANAFAHESGIHQDGMLKDRTTYEIMVPEDVGLSGTELVLGKHSGRHALGAHLARLGFQLKEEELVNVYNRFKELCDKKKVVYDDDLMAIMQEQAHEVPEGYTLDYLHVSTGTGTVPTATVRLKKAGKVMQDASTGDGPVDAALQVIDRITGVDGKLEDFSLQAVTKGEDAVGEVSVRVNYGDEVVQAKGSSTDIIEASAKAYLNALNRYVFMRRALRGRKRVRAQS